MLKFDRVSPQLLQSDCARLSCRLSRRRSQPLPRLRPDPLADRPACRPSAPSARLRFRSRKRRPRARRPRRCSGAAAAELRRAQRRLDPATKSSYSPVSATGVWWRSWQSAFASAFRCSRRPPPAPSGASDFTLVNGTGARARANCRSAGAEPGVEAARQCAGGGRSSAGRASRIRIARSTSAPTCRQGAGDLGRGQSVRRESGDSEARRIGRRVGRLRS